MKKTLLVAAVLALTVVSLCAAAAPALAEFPATGVPQTAYVHPWWGAEPIIWEECDSTEPDAVWSTWSATEPALSWAPYKAIPATYDIVFVAWMQGIPRGQMAAIPGDLLLAGTLDDPAGGDPLWSITTKEAKRHWGKAMGPDGWSMPTFNKEDAQMWVIAWTYDLGYLPAGTYSGVATYIFKHNAIDHTWWNWWDPTAETMKTPTHLMWKGTYTSPFTFVVE